MTASLDTVCNGQCLTFSQQSHNYSQNYRWTFAGGIPDNYTGSTPPAICYAAPGNYTIELYVTNAGGQDSKALQVAVLPKPTAAFANTAITIPYHTQLILAPCAAAARTQWYLNDSLVCDNCTDYTLDASYYLSNYKCIISNGNCSDSCNYKVTVTGIPNDVWLPTAFTPNGDGLNDYFSVVTNNPNIEVFGLAVYDRWGQCIFDGLGKTGWNGNYRSAPMQMGTYFWTLRYRVAGSNAVYNRTGNVTLMR
jgi:gliding motility-associated-like protein